ncbi:hypothetical protein HK100_004987 [Physocladia obscura]|uniref:Uncharacterized protein n=1 Tax=Physocladia obscura TaxID=109957 RepID=A0AAD5XIY7_9FUNG|nr:hypothetical protein HK100_004987 [Physocladia obscura]
MVRLEQAAKRRQTQTTGKERSNDEFTERDWRAGGVNKDSSEIDERPVGDGEDNIVVAHVYCNENENENESRSENIGALACGFSARAAFGYLWHRQQLRLRLRKDLHKNFDSFGLQTGHFRHNLPLLSATTNVGDCISDVWRIVSILRFVSEKLPQLCISVTDADGLFLLIEAADALPVWLDAPSAATNRVWIHKNNLHIIPPSLVPLSRSITVARAVELVLANPQATLADTQIQTLAFAKCPLLFTPQNDLHRVQCAVPRGIARCLAADESLVSAAVHAFYQRDPFQLKSCQSMRNFHPSTTILTTVKMTRIMYAQLASQQQFTPPKPFTNHISVHANRNDEKIMRAYDIGTKLTVGFEIIATSMPVTASNDASPNLNNNFDSYSFETDAQWRAFKTRLEKLEYFKDEIVGSRMYQALEREAKIQYLEHISKKLGKKNKNGDDDVSDVESNDSDEIAADNSDFENNSTQRLYAALVKVPENIPDSEIIKNDPEDDDAWMYVDPESLDSLLSGIDAMRRELDESDLVSDDDDEGMATNETVQERRAEKRGVAQLEKIVQGFSKFVGKKSGVDGVLFPGEKDETKDEESLFDSDNGSDEYDFDQKSSSDSDTENFMDQNNESDDETKPIEIDDEKFMKSLMKLLGVDETILKNSTAPILKNNKQKNKKSQPQHSVPKAPPASFDPQSLTLRPPPASAVSTNILVTLDDSDDDAEDLSGSRGFGIVGNRRGIQAQDEGDSDDEREILSGWDDAFLKELSRIDVQLKNSVLTDSTSDFTATTKNAKKMQRAVDSDDGSDSEDDVDELDMQLDEYMEAMDLELSRKKLVRVGGRSGDSANWKEMFREQNFENVDDRPKWKLRRMEAQEILLENDDDNDVDDDEEMDLDANLVKNLLESFEAQQGLPGPASNILGRMGLQIPINNE